jgi:hypothetical protein
MLDIKSYRLFLYRSVLQHSQPFLHRRARLYSINPAAYVGVLSVLNANLWSQTDPEKSFNIRNPICRPSKVIASRKIHVKHRVETFRFVNKTVNCVGSVDLNI